MIQCAGGCKEFLVAWSFCVKARLGSGSRTWSCASMGAFIARGERRPNSSATPGTSRHNFTPIPIRIGMTERRRNVFICQRCRKSKSGSPNKVVVATRAVTYQNGYYDRGRWVDVDVSTGVETVREERRCPQCLKDFPTLPTLIPENKVVRVNVGAEISTRRFAA